jgi:uncharacterized protein YndB with AHSA1/START domain
MAPVEHARGIAASKARIWQVLSNPKTWHRWNPGVAAIELEGVFETGTFFTMLMPDGERIRSQLIHVDPTSGFTDETALGELTIVVEHLMEALDSEHTRVTYRLVARGADAERVSRAVSADFPAVLAGLAQVAESRESQHE